MNLLDHVSTTVRDLEQSRPFYKAVMSALGAPIAHEDMDAIGFGERNGPGNDAHTYITVLASPDSTADRRRHWCFRASSVEQVNEFHKAGLAAGGRDSGAPGNRDYHDTYYAAFLLDPEGNRIEAVFHGAQA